MSRLVGGLLTKHHHKKYFCDRCLCYVNNEVDLKYHQLDCESLNKCKIEMPTKEESNLSFNHFSRKLDVPFLIYADLESILKKKSKDNIFQTHKPSSIGYYFKCFDNSLSFYKTYRGKDCILWFLKELEEICKIVKPFIDSPKPLKMTKKELIDFNNSQMCHICETIIDNNDDNNCKVRDHCHLTGKYRGSAHSNCNLNYSESLKRIPVFFHNFSGYDSHFLVRELSKVNKGKMELIAQSSERYIAVTKEYFPFKIKFQFLDSLKFLSASLSELADNLKDFPYLEKEFSCLSKQNLALLKKKGVFPYDYVDSFKKYSEPKLPSHQNFINKLSKSNITIEEYKRAKHIWKQFKIRNLGEYSDLYLKTDVMLLVDIFETFRTKSKKTYGLDPAHYLTLPGYTWDAMLLFTKVNLQLFNDEQLEMLMMVERGIRGGLSQCSKRFSKANNPYLESFDKTKPQRFINYSR